MSWSFLLYNICFSAKTIGLVCCSFDSRYFFSSLDCIRDLSRTTNLSCNIVTVILYIYGVYILFNFLHYNQNCLYNTNWYIKIVLTDIFLLFKEHRAAVRKNLIFSEWYYHELNRVLVYICASPLKYKVSPWNLDVLSDQPCRGTEWNYYLGKKSFPVLYSLFVPCLIK